MRTGEWRSASASGSNGGMVRFPTEQRVVACPVVLGRQPELRGVGCWLVEVVVWQRALAHHELDELGHRRTEAIAVVGIDDVLIAISRSSSRVTSGGLVGDESVDILRVSDHPVQGQIPPPLDPKASTGARPAASITRW